MKPTTVKLAALALFYLSRNASNPCYDTGCFLGVCKYTPPQVSRNGKTGQFTMA